jgi:hypothetical protein
MKAMVGRDRRGAELIHDRGQEKEHEQDQEQEQEAEEEL